FSMRELDPAWPPGTLASMTRTSRPSDAPYTAAARPEGPAPTTARSTTWVPSSASLNPRQSTICAFVGLRRIACPRPITTGMRRDPRVARRGTHNLQLAGYDDEQRDTPVAGVVQHFAERRRTAPPADRHSGDLRRRQRRKGVLRVDNGGLQKAHR